MGETCNTQWEENKCVQGLETIPEGKRPLGTSRRRCKDDTKTHFMEEKVG
jgi:hypothetical protein